MPDPPYLRAQQDGTLLLSIKVIPRASKDEIGTPLGPELRAKVTAPPVDAAANQALLRLLTRTLDCSRNQLEIVRGHTSRHKAIRISGMPLQTALGRLSGADAKNAKDTESGG